MNIFANFEWSPDMSGRCGDPRLIAESIVNLITYAGFQRVIVTSLVLYLGPILLICLICRITYFSRKRGFFFKWPDFFLLAVPVGLWLLLAIVYPIGRPTSSFWELILLGSVAALTIVFRPRYVDEVKLDLSKAGLLGTTSLAVLFWVFMPEWNIIF